MTNNSTPPEDPASNDMDEAQRAAYERAEHEAQVLEEFFPSVVSDLLCQMALGKHVGASGYKLFHDNLTSECNLDHPLAKLMADQLAWAHFAIGNLHVRAAGAMTEDIRIAMTAAAGRLMIEFRKSFAALREYQTPADTDETVAEQTAEEGDQPGAIHSSAAARPAAEKNATDIKVGTNGGHSNGASTNGSLPSSNRRPAESIKKEEPIARRPAKVG